ncbi:MAG: hypothetical protein QM710_02945 [Flavobacterium sp.]
MKKAFLLLFLLSCSFINAQYDAKKLQTKQDYTAANKQVLEASKYVLSVPYDESNQKRTEAVQYILKWMDGSPDYSFTIDADIMDKVVAKDNGLLGIYMACMAKFCLENEAYANDSKIVKISAIKLIIAYAENPKNKVKMSKPLKKLADADKKGELEREFQ